MSTISSGATKVPSKDGWHLKTLKKRWTFFQRVQTHHLLRWHCVHHANMLGLCTSQTCGNGLTSWMWMTLRPPCFSPISCCSVEIRDHRCWRRRTSHSTQSKWTVVRACVCSNREGLKAPCRVFQKEASPKIQFKKRWLVPDLFVFRSMGTTLGQIYSCCTFCTHFSKAGPPFRCQLQRRGLCIRHMMRHTLPPIKRRRVIEVTSLSSEKTEEYGHGSSMSKREQSWRFGSTPPTNCSCCVLSAMALQYCHI